MLTVGEMINWLKDFDEDAQILIGMEQRYGSDFAYTIGAVDEHPLNDWDNPVEKEERERVVVITLGSQIGTIDYDESEKWI